jgi:phage terminase small subunit
VKKSLTPKQVRFVAEYLIDLNGAAAARRAGYSAKNADDQAGQLLRIPHVSAAIEIGLAERAARTQVKQDNVIRELALLSFSSIGNYERSGDTVATREGVDPAALRAVSGVKCKSWTDKDGESHEEMSYTLWSKTDALRLLAQHLGMLTEKLEIDAKKDVLDIILAARGAAK